MSHTAVSHKTSGPEPMSLDTNVHNTKLNTAYSAFARLLPDHPYVLGVPNFDLPLKHPRDLSLEESRWIRDSPFESNEAHLQYMTHVLRDPADSCYELRTQVDEEREYRMKESQKNGGSGLDAPFSTPKFGPAKKKISLADYQKKSKGPGSESEISPVIGALLPAKHKDKTSIAPTGVNGRIAKVDADDPVIEQVKNAVFEMENDYSNSKHDDLLNRKSPKAAESTLTKQSPGKSQSRNAKDEQETAKSTIAMSAIHSLPMLLSPGKESSASPPRLRSPNTDSASNPHGLPPMLSPTLPADLEKAWREARKDRVRANSDVSSRSALSDSRSSKYVTPSKSVKAQAQNTVTSKLVKSHDKDDAEYKSALLSTELDTSDRDKREHGRLVVKLRYSRKIHRQIQLIVKGASKSLHPSLGPAFAEKPVQKSAKSSSKVANDTDQAQWSPLADRGDTTTDRGSKPESKKRFSDADWPDKPSKKSRPSPLASGLADLPIKKHAADPPVTPIQDEFEVRKHELVTPKSHTGARLSIPHNLTPLPPGRINSTDRLPKTTSSAASSRPLVKMPGFAECSRSLNKAGRDLKYKAQDLSKTISDTGTCQKQQAVMMLESSMAFMLAYSYQDEFNRSKGVLESWESTWHTIVPFLDSVARYTRLFPDLEAVRCYLSYAAARRTITNILAQILSTTAVTADTPTPGASGPDHRMSPPDANSHAATSSVAGSMHSELELARKMAAYEQKARVYITEASSKLPPDAIAKRYPRTWAARERTAPHDPNPGSRERKLMSSLVEAKNPGGQVLRGPFWLPITEAVTPVSAVRFATTLCVEWAKIEHLQYESRLEKSG